MRDHPKTTLRLLPGLALAAGLAALTSASLRSSQRADGVQEARAVLEQWVDTERVLSREKRDWELGREILGDRIELVQRELASLRASIAEAEASIAEADTKREQLVADNERLKAGSVELEGLVVALEARLRSLLARLPEPIAERVRPLSQRLPAPDAEQVKASLGERFQNVVGILNEVNKFHGELSLTSEVRTLDDGSTAEVTAVYLGLGQGYYVTGDGARAGVGTATDEGWVWRADDSAAAVISEAVRILQNEQPAAFVHLPVRID